MKSGALRGNRSRAYCLRSEAALCKKNMARFNPRILLPLFVLLLCYLVFFYRLGDYALWDPDEGRTGVIAKEMAVSGNWLTLTENGSPYYDKPAPYFWLVALALKLLGFGELAVRLPSAVAASLTVGLVCLWGGIQGDWKKGLLGASVLATSLEFAGLGRFGRVDMVFTFFFTAALLGFLWWKERDRVPIWPFFLFLALATLAKGPAGTVLPVLIIIIALALEKKLPILRRMRWLQGTAIFLIVAGSWYLLAGLWDPDYIKSFLWEHNVLRYLTRTEQIKHIEPIYFLLGVLIAGFLPWSLFLPALLHSVWERRNGEGKEERLFLLVWAVTVLIFFSLSRNKLGTYVLPLFPPLALLTADWLKRYAENQETSLWRKRWPLLATLVWLIFLFAAPAISDRFLSDPVPKYLSLDLPLYPIAFFLLLAGAAGLLRRQKWTPWIVACSSLWLILWFYSVKAPEISWVRSTRELARIIKDSAREEVRVVAFRAHSLSFYLATHVELAAHPATVERMLREPVPTVALIKEKQLKEITEPAPSRFFIWKSIPPSALVANFPPSPAGDLSKTPKN